MSVTLLVSRPSAGPAPTAGPSPAAAGLPVACAMSPFCRCWAWGAVAEASLDAGSGNDSSGVIDPKQSNACCCGCCCAGCAAPSSLVGSMTITALLVVRAPAESTSDCAVLMFALLPSTSRTAAPMAAAYAAVNDGPLLQGLLAPGKGLTLLLRENPVRPPETTPAHCA